MLTTLGEVRHALGEALRPIDGSNPKSDNVSLVKVIDEIEGMMPDSLALDYERSDTVERKLKKKRVKTALVIIIKDEASKAILSGEDAGPDELFQFMYDELERMLVDELGFRPGSMDGDYERGNAYVTITLGADPTEPTAFLYIEAI